MQNSHIVSRYDKNLDRIKSGILDMGDLVISQLGQATDTLANFDADLVAELIATDRKINGMHKNIYMRAERLIALRQPVALDLRQAMLPVNIAGHLERIGDHAKSIAKRARKIEPHSLNAHLLANITKMSLDVQGMLSDALRAYDESDIALADDIRARDAQIDQMNDDLFAAVVAEIAKSPASAEPDIHAILLARGLERAGDHVVNIARHVHQIVTGEDLKASD